MTGVFDRAGFRVGDPVRFAESWLNTRGDDVVVTRVEIGRQVTVKYGDVPALTVPERLPERA